MVHYFDLLLSNTMIQTNSSHQPKAAQRFSCCSRCKFHSNRISSLLCGPHWQSNRRRFWLIWIFFAISSYVMCLANVATEYRSETQLRHVILPDIGFDFTSMVTPEVTTWIKWPDISVGIASSFSFLWLLVDGPKDQKLSIFRRFMTICSMMYLLRSICVISTQLPNPFQTDDPKYHDKWSKDILYEALLCLFRLKATNNDVFFSGHTVMITMCALTLDTYCRRRWIIWIFWICALCTLYVIIATRFHYTIDVVIAFTLSVILWKFYHLALSIEEIRNNYPIFKYLESDKESEIYRRSASESNRNKNSSDKRPCRGSLSAPLMIHNGSDYNLDSVQIVADIVELSEERPMNRYQPRTPKSISRTQSITKSDLP